MKIYSDDPLVPYRNTKIPPLTTKAEIDGLLARWGATDSGWRWKPADGEVFVVFQIHETVSGSEVMPRVKVECPVIWTRGKRKRPRDEINWSVSMRVLYWYLKSHLEAAYLAQSPKTGEFLPHVQLALPDREVSLGSLLIPRVDSLRDAKALPFLEPKEAT